MASPRLQYVTTDVFTETPYEGNPLAIVRVPPSVKLNQDQKQNIAKEFNYSETVILHENEESYRKSEWTINIFLTTAEIPLAGHPLIGTVCYLGSTLQATGAGGNIQGVLNTKAGKVSFTYSTETRHAEAEIPHDVCLHKPTLDSAAAAKHGVPDEVCKAIVKPAAVVSIVKGMTFCLVELSSLEALGRLGADLREAEFAGLDQEYFQNGFVGFLFFVRDKSATDGVTKVRTRMISGVLEDPATGSASSALAAYLGFLEHGWDQSQKAEQTFELTQGVEMGRKSVIGVKVIADVAAKKIQKVVLSGTAVEVMEGSLRVPS